MIEERDPMLQGLFTAAAQPGFDDDFAARVVARIDAQRRQVLVGWAVAGLVMVALGWFLYEPLQDAVFGLSGLLPSQLIAIDTAWASQLLAPVNSIAAVVGVSFLAGRAFYKRLFTS